MYRLTTERLEVLRASRLRLAFIQRNIQAVIREIGVGIDAPGIDAMIAANEELAQAENQIQAWLEHHADVESFTQAIAEFAEQNEGS